MRGVADLVSPVLVGRERELERLRAALDRTTGGEAGVVLVGGEAGIGKSRLLEAAFDGVPTARMLTGGCIELGGEGLPFVPLVQALRTLVRTTAPADLDGLLGPARAELGRLLPELAVAGDGPVQPTGSTAQLFELVLGVLGRLGAERPLVLVVEDLHWADRSTLDLVTFLVRALQGLRVLLVLTYRSDEVDRRSPLRPLLTSWERLRGVERLQLERLTRAQVGTQIGAILGAAADPQTVELVHDRSEGNPFFVEELLRTLREGESAAELPPSLRDILLARAERLSPPAQRLLRTAAVAGRAVPERLLAEVAGVPSAERYEALREAVDASLLVVDESGRGYAFRHALTRDAVYQDLLPGERVDLHTAYAEALERDPGLAGDDSSVSATLAVHWYAAHDLPRSLAASIRAGEEAAEAYAPAEARRHLERALEIWRQVPDPESWAGVDQIEVLRRAGRAAHLTGDAARARSLFEQALAMLGHDTDPERVALLLEQRAHTLRMLGEDGASMAGLEDALTWLPEDPPSEARARILASLANSLLRLGDDRALAAASVALDAARAAGARHQEASALITLGVATGYLEDARRGDALLREGLRLALDLGDHDQALRGYANLSDRLEALGDHHGSVEAARAGVELARRVGQYRTFGVFITANLVDPLMVLGEWDEADRLLRADLAIGPSGVFEATLLERLANLTVQRGAIEEALDHHRQARRALGESREPQFTHALAFVDAEGARARGDLAGAAAQVIAGLADITSWSNRYGWPLIWLGARIEADRAVHARDRNELPPAPFLGSVPLAQATPDFAPGAIAYHVMTEAEGRRRDGDPAVDAWQAAVAAWENAGDAWPLAYARFRLGEALCAEGRREEATAPLRASAATATRLGARPLLDDVEALARRARITLDEAAPEPSAVPPEVPFGLTEREREVLDLVAAGRSNGQIAAALFISPKTASVHVSNILAKLGVSGRVEAAAVAHRLGLTARAP
jgi:DNA-binding CsgD family transcriptional regulator/tetratricopeptide (TPR) repeat protein